MDEIEHQVEKITKKRFFAGQAQYRLKWVGFSSKHNSWEPADHLNCPELLEEFEKQNAMAFCGRYTFYTDEHNLKFSFQILFHFRFQVQNVKTASWFTF